KRACNEVAAQFDRQGADIDGGQIVRHPALCFRTEVRCGRELTFGQSVYAIVLDRKSTRLNSSHSQISYAVFCLKKKKKKRKYEYKKKKHKNKKNHKPKI